MKNLLVILSILFSSLSYAIEIDHIPINEGPQYIHQLSIDPSFAGDYPPYTGELDTEGFSYTWYTDEGHISNAISPQFYFSEVGPHQISLMLTPRKKGDHDLKEFHNFSITVADGQESTLSNGNFLDAAMHIDGQARKGDRILVVVPLNPCKFYPAKHDYRVSYNTYMLEYITTLPHLDLTESTISYETEDVSGTTLNKNINFSHNWDHHETDKVAVLVFKVLSNPRDPVILKFHKDPVAKCDKDDIVFDYAIKGPYDPNFKESNLDKINVFEEPIKETTTTEVMYTIHFQNIGTGPVDSITIFDTLPSYLTFISFEGSSEPAALVTATHASGELKWIIAPNADIRGTNEVPAQPESSTRGWVKFKAEISKENDIAYDTCYCLRNTANIYFDDLAPIATEPDLIVIGDALCFSPSSSAQGSANWAETICNLEPGSLANKTQSTSLTTSTSFTNYLAYPNPVNHSFQLKGNTEAIVGIEVINALGQRVLNLSQYTESIDLENQPRGLYFIRIKTNEKHHVLRIQKN